jgi:hypothetical protein
VSRSVVDFGGAVRTGTSMCEKKREMMMIHPLQIDDSSTGLQYVLLYVFESCSYFADRRDYVTLFTGTHCTGVPPWLLPDV